MRIAVASDGLNISSVCNLCSNFTCYQIRRGIIYGCQNLPNPCYSIEALATLFHELDVRVIIGNFINNEEAHAFEKVNIEVVRNNTGSTLRAVERYLAHLISDFDESDED